MSKVVAALLDNAYQDSQLLQGNDEKGDVFSIPRDIDFFLYAKDKEKGELVTNFINDNCYGTTSYSENEGNHCVKVVINMPSTQNLISSVSGLLTCLAVIYDLEYDGWVVSYKKTHNKAQHTVHCVRWTRTSYACTRLCGQR